MLAVRREGGKPGGLAICEVDIPLVASNETLVRVVAVSVGHDDVEHFAAVIDGSRLGWNLAGTVEIAASNQSGPRIGARVAGLVQFGAWSQFSVVPSDSIAEIPDSVTFAQAAATPSAGLTALYGLEQGGLLTARRVLVACAAGAVGLFAVQLARIAGAEVTAVIQAAEHEALLEEYGADHVVLGALTGATQFGPYHLALINAADHPDFTATLRLVKSHGLCVLYGTALTQSAYVDNKPLVGNSIRLHRLVVLEYRIEQRSEDLRRLFSLIAKKELQPHIEIEDSWIEISAVSKTILENKIVGRAVLYL